MNKELYRHGDVFLKGTETPKKLETKFKGESYVLAYGEVTGHKHLLTAEPGTQIEIAQDEQGRSYLKLNGNAKLTHEEHKELVIEKGVYLIQKEREFDYFKGQAFDVLD